MKKILILTSTFPKETTDKITARFVWDLAESLKEFYQVFVLCPHSDNLKIKEDWSGVQICRFKYFFPANIQLLSSGNGIMNDIKNNFLAIFQIPGFFISQYLNAMRIIRDNGIDIVNTHWIVPQGLIGAFLKRKTGALHVNTAHAADVFLLKRMRSVAGGLVDFILKYTDLVIPVSTFINATLGSLTNKKYASCIIPMGAGHKFYNNPDKYPQEGKTKPLRLLFVGKFIEKKGIIFLLKSMLSLKKEGIEFFLSLAGGGSLESNLKTFVLSNGLKDNVDFLGWVHNDELPELYDSCDIVVVPSVFDRKGETEGLPVVIPEALARGKPVIASRISGIPDVVRDGYNGWLVEPGNPLSIAGKIKEIRQLNLEPFRRNALKSSEELTYEKIALRYKEVMDKL